MMGKRTGHHRWRLPRSSRSGGPQNEWSRRALLCRSRLNGVNGRTADRAGAFQCRFAVLHRDGLAILNIALGLALDAIALCHALFTSFRRKVLLLYHQWARPLFTTALQALCPRTRVGRAPTRPIMREGPAESRLVSAYHGAIGRHQAHLVERFVSWDHHVC